MNREFLKSGDLIPLSGSMPGDGEPGQCAEYLLDILESDEGIVGVDFDTGSARLSVQYDAAVLPAHRADEIAEDIGAAAGVAPGDVHHPRQRGRLPDLRGHAAAGAAPAGPTPWRRS